LGLVGLMAVFGKAALHLTHTPTLSILDRDEYHSGSGRNRNLVGGADRNEKEQIASSKK